jgi:hypothetical protein
LLHENLASTTANLLSTSINLFPSLFSSWTVISQGLVCWMARQPYLEVLSSDPPPHHHHQQQRVGEEHPIFQQPHQLL